MGVVRLADEVAHMKSMVSLAVVWVQAGRKDDDVAGKAALAETAHESQTAETRHLVVGDDKVESVGLCGKQVERVLTVVGKNDVELGGGEKTGKRIPNVGVVLGAKDAQRPWQRNGEVIGIVRSVHCSGRAA